MHLDNPVPIFYPSSAHVTPFPLFIKYFPIRVRAKCFLVRQECKITRFDQMNNAHLDSIVHSSAHCSVSTVNMPKVNMSAF